MISFRNKCNYLLWIEYLKTTSTNVENNVYDTIYIKSRLVSYVHKSIGSKTTNLNYTADFLDY